MTSLKQLLHRYAQIESQRLLAGLREDFPMLADLDVKMIELFAEAYFEGYPLDVLVMLQAVPPGRLTELTKHIHRHLDSAKQRGIPLEWQNHLQRWILAISMLQAIEEPA